MSKRLNQQQRLIRQERIAREMGLLPKPKEFIPIKKGPIIHAKHKLLAMLATLR